MAIYEFECLKCKKNFEEEQPMSSEHIASCPFCETDKTKRLFSMPALIVRSSAYSMAKNHAPKTRLENMEKVRAERSERQKNATSERDSLDNSYHKPSKKTTNSS